MNDSDSATVALLALAHDTGRLLTNRLQPHDLTVPQLRFLADLVANPDHIGADAARACHVSPQTGTTILHNLAAKQLIVIEQVPGGGHRNEITVTARGTDILGRAMETIADVDKQLAAALGVDVASTMYGALEALQSHLPQRRPQPHTTAGNGN